MNKYSLSDKAIFLIISKALTAIANLTLGIVLVRLLSKSDYGTYLQVMLICSTISLIATFGIPHSVYYFVPQFDLKKQKIFLLQTLFFLFTIGAIASIVCFLSRDLIGQWMSNPSLAKIAIIFSGYLLFVIPDQFLEPMLISRDKAKLAAGINAIFSISFIIFALLPIIFGLGLPALFLSILFFYLLKFLFLILYTLKTLGGLRKDIYNFGILKSQIYYSFPLGISSMMGMLSSRIDRFMISFWFPPDSFAIFARGAFELPLVSMLPYTISNILMPRYVELYKENNQEEFLKLWHESIRKTALIILPVFVFTFIVSEKLITLLFTSDYSGSTIIFRTYLLLLPLRLTAYGAILRAMGDTKSVLRASLLFLIANIALNIVFYKIFGFIGPAIATVAAMNLNILYYISKIQKTFNLTFLRILPWNKILKIAVVSVIVGIIVYPLMFLNISKIATLSLSFVFFGIFYFLIAFKMRIFTSSDISLIKKWLTLAPLRSKN